MEQHLRREEPTARSVSSGSAARLDIGNRMLVCWLSVTALLIAATCIAWLIVPAELRKPGTPALQSCAIAGSILLLAPTLFSLSKRGGLTSSPPTWFVVHVLASMLGMLLVFVHAAGRLSGPPVLLLLLVAFLATQGVWARVALGGQLAQVFSTRLHCFTALDGVRRVTLRDVIEAKRTLLAHLEFGAHEATFSPSLRHWLRHPVLAARYALLATQETRLIGVRNSVAPTLAWWRRVHIAIAVLFVAGMLLHTTLAVFFAGYVAGGNDVYWWHVTTWGGAP